MITFFATPKPFKGHNAIIQRNAIHSWSLINPECEVILFGNDEGTAEMAAEYGLRHIQDVKCNEFGTPLVSDMFSQAQQSAKHDLLCYANSDIIFLSDFLPAVIRMSDIKRRFLMIGQMYDLDIVEHINFSPGWEGDIRKLLAKRGLLRHRYGMDYFVFRRGSYPEIPPFAIGRPRWDKWMVYHARTSGLDVIDATPVVTVIHQNHDYSHIPQGKGIKWEGPEAEINRSMVGHEVSDYTLNDANFTLTSNYLRPSRCPTLEELPAPLSQKLSCPWTEESDQLPDVMAGGARWPRISIVTPLDNRGDFLEETIRSVLLQGYPNLEYIVVCDDSSTNISADGCADTIEKYEPWIKRVHCRRDEGQAAALAEGFRHSSGDILAWLKPGDRYRPYTLERVALFFVGRPKVVLGGGDINLIDAEGHLINRIYSVRPNRIVRDNMAIRCWPSQGGFWRSRAYERAGGIDRSLQFNFCLDLFLRLLSRGRCDIIRGGPIADFRQHNALSTSGSSKFLDIKRHEDDLMIARHGSLRLKKSPALMKLYWKLGIIPAKCYSFILR